MNTANVMAISPKAGAAPKVQPTRTVSRNSTGSTKDSFGEVLGKAGEDAAGKTAKSAVQGSEQGNIEAKEADIKDDMPDGTEAALNKQQGKEQKAGKAAKDGKDAQGAKATEGSEASAGEQELGKLAAQAVVLNFSTEGQAALVMEEVPQQAEAAATVNLQSLLPQSAEDTQKNKNFLAMLSGQQVKRTGHETALENIQPELNQNPQAGSLEINQSAKPATLLEVQLSNHQIANQAANATDELTANQTEMPSLTVLNNGKERADAKGMAPFEQSEETMPSMPAGKVNDSVTLQQAAGQGKISEVMVQPLKTEEGQPVNNPLAGVNITVEDEVPVVTQSMNAQQNQLDGKGRPTTQLPEEAVGDKAPVQQSANNEPISMFQQSLNESLTGAKGTADVNQPQNVQEDFGVPRQIVEQARLLRRGQDTQMVIKLHPDHLGELTLKVSVSAGGAINASFHSDNAQVRAIIENTLVQLKQELNNQGLKVDNVDVYAGLTDGQLPQGEGQQAWQQNQGHSGNSIRNIGNVEDYGEETENIAVSQQNTADVADGVDYRV
ncbi:flagellar hook-length control protein FliK [Selenomonas ruminantium]|uniref:Flagellar hook-length control protein FliK n=1 Tax=Selenomonas ruminantium TaxID=971 RepID=A0A1I0X1A1_SELRU|nr:flagellar hook-length control protein FliK [Selenomonas ruminantium]SFA94681.1 flagellar hook-length control protein FliK [Selenomonas ruminantium]